ncbi:MAG: hypothetical protein JO021_03670, partial [Alphaproteobacteria bacterium]|nr:hypothetical protein [Alphaproteobacteria bacterium]
ALVLVLATLDVADRALADIMTAVVGATTAVSGAAYAVKWVRRLSGLEPT